MVIQSEPKLSPDNCTNDILRKDKIKKFVEDKTHQKYFIAALLDYQGVQSSDPYVKSGEFQCRYLAAYILFYSDLKTIIEESLQTRDQSIVQEYAIFVAKYFYDLQHGITCKRG